MGHGAEFLMPRPPDPGDDMALSAVMATPRCPKCGGRLVNTRALTTSTTGQPQLAVMSYCPECLARRSMGRRMP